MSKFEKDLSLRGDLAEAHLEVADLLNANLKGADLQKLNL